MRLNELTIAKLRQLLDTGEVSPSDILDHVYQRITEVEGRIGAFITLTEGHARKMSLEAQTSLKERRPSVLTGIPLAVKDNICTAGIRTTCASNMLADFVPPYESTVASRLTQAGYLLVGKTNMDEFAMGSSTENSGFKVTRNPWDLDRVPGGSSGGSAAAVAAGECIAAIGSDTGGSIRQPAAFCGVVGLKPTYGRVSRYGLVAFASSLDQIGPITRDVTDAAILLGVMAGNDPLDSTSAPVEVPDYTAVLGKEIKGVKVGIPREYFVEGVDPEVEASVQEAIRVLESLGADIREVSLPHTPYAIAAYYLIATSEASSNLARYDGVKYGFRVPLKDLHEMYRETRARGFGSEVKRRIMLGTYALSSGYYDAYYGRAQQARTLIKRDFDVALAEVDILITPTSPTPAFRIGEKTADPLQMYLTDIFTISVNLAGVPAISVPCGFSSSGLPIGLQLIGRHFDEATLLKVAHAYEVTGGRHSRRPAL